MKRIPVILVFSLISFTLGAGVSSIRYVGPIQANTASTAPSLPSPGTNPAPCLNQTQSNGDEFPGLIDDKYVTKFNGTKLDLDYDSWGAKGNTPYLIDGAKVLPLKSGGLLVDVGDTLYRLDGRNHVVWTYDQGQLILDFTLVESTNLVYGTAGDNVMFVLDATTGKELHSDSRNGRAAYGVAQNYGNDTCLVTDNFVMYREDDRHLNIEPTKDGITCWRGTEALWHQDFPPDAQLVVNGERILAVTKTRTGIYVNEITAPRSK
jgi:hypothetical protein